MKLSKLYCNKGNFKNIEFNLNGLSVVSVDIKSKTTEKKNQHSLGKTKLAQLIDFMMLKSISKSHFLLKHRNKEGSSIFGDYIFYLEVLLNSGEFLTIRRGLEANTKISFSISEKKTIGFSAPLSWDHENITLKKSKVILSELLSMDFFKNKETYDYRKSLGYSLRTQADYLDVYTLNKFSAGRHIFWKPFMFDLLGFNGKLLQTKYANDSAIEKIGEFIKNLKNEYSVKVEARDEIVAQQLTLKDKITELEGQIDRFNFYEQDKELIDKGISEIESNISELNADAYRLNYELDKLNKSIKNKFSFNIDKVKQVFKESKLYFPDQLKADYQQLISFNDQLTSERNKLIRSTIKKKKGELKNVNSSLLEANRERESLLATLVDSDTFTKFKAHQKELAKVESKMLTFKEKLDAIDKIIEKEKEIEQLKEHIKTTVDQIKLIYQTTDKNKKYSKIRTTFSRFYKEIMNEDATISLQMNGENNIDFPPPKVRSRIKEKENTAKDEGNTYKKLLCVAFDLAILVTYNVESYYRFVYHDDVFSQQDNGIKNRLMELVRSLTDKYDLQYLLSVVQSDLPRDSNDKLIEFSKEEIILRLHDQGPSGTLFGLEF